MRISDWSSDVCSSDLLIVDFGSQVTQLIARRVRESGVYCEIQPFGKVDAEAIRAFDPAGIILSGGPASVTADASPRAPEAVFEAGLPVPGFCYGQRTECDQTAGGGAGNKHRELCRGIATGDRERHTHQEG